MSHQDVEIWRANVDALRAQLAAGSTAEGTISTLAEIWDPQDMSQSDALEATGLSASAAPASDDTQASAMKPRSLPQIARSASQVVALTGAKAAPLLLRNATHARRGRR